MLAELAVEVDDEPCQPNANAAIDSLKGQAKLQNMFDLRKAPQPTNGLCYSTQIEEITHKLMFLITLLTLFNHLSVACVHHPNKTGSRLHKRGTESCNMYVTYACKVFMYPCSSFRNKSIIGLCTTKLSW